MSCCCCCPSSCSGDKVHRPSKNLWVCAPSLNGVQAEVGTPVPILCSRWALPLFLKRCLRSLSHFYYVKPWSLSRRSLNTVCSCFSFFFHCRGKKGSGRWEVQKWRFFLAKKVFFFLIEQVGQRTTPSSPYHLLLPPPLPPLLRRLFDRRCIFRHLPAPLTSTTLSFKGKEKRQCKVGTRKILDLFFVRVECCFFIYTYIHYYCIKVQNKMTVAPPSHKNATTLEPPPKKYIFKI